VQRLEQLSRNDSVEAGGRKNTNSPESAKPLLMYRNRCVSRQAQLHSQLPLFRSERRRGLGRGGAFKPENDLTVQNGSEHPLPRPLSRSCVAGEGGMCSLNEPRCLLLQAHSNSLSSARSGGEGWGEEERLNLKMTSRCRMNQSTLSPGPSPAPASQARGECVA